MKIVLIDRIKELINRIKDRINEFFISFKDGIKELKAFITGGFAEKGKERNRLIILSLSYLFLLDYIMFSYHTDKNVFDIFPSIPVIEDKVEINIFLPSLDGTSIVKEKRSVPKFSNNERFAKFLFGQVMKGSIYENTTQAVPIDLFVRNIWLTGDSQKRECIIDIVPSYIEEKMKTISGSESLFKESLAKTLKENIPGITNIHILVRGIPGRSLWEL